MVFLIKEVKEVDILIKEEEVEEAITIIIMVSTTTKEDLVILGIILIQGSLLSYKALKDLQASLHLIGYLVKSVAKVVIQLLIVIIGWILHTKEGIHLLSWLQWWLTLLKCRVAMVGLQTQVVQTLLLLICLNCLFINNLLWQRNCYSRQWTRASSYSCWSW